MLEAVKVEHQDGERLPVLPQLFACRLDLVEEERPIGDAGQQIVVRQPLDLRLGARVDR